MACCHGRNVDPFGEKAVIDDKNWPNISSTKMPILTQIVQ
jgi:hypothetical protein